MMPANENSAFDSVGVAPDFEIALTAAEEAIAYDLTVENDPQILRAFEMMDTLTGASTAAGNAAPEGDVPAEGEEFAGEEEPVEDENAVKPEDATFVVNRNSLTVHELDCHHIEAMSEKNIKYTDLTLEELLATEHVPCGACMPDEYKKYKEEHGLDGKK
jgi:hypothetical protein